MRTLELSALFVALFAVLWPVLFGVRPRRGIVPMLAVIALIAHLTIEGGRWQMIPIYLVLVGVTAGDVFFVGRDLQWSRRVARGFFGVLGLALAASLPLVLPVPELPVPSGPEQIGTTSLELVDDDRAEIYGETPWAASTNHGSGVVPGSRHRGVGTSRVELRLGCGRACHGIGARFSPVDPQSHSIHIVELLRRRSDRRVVGIP